MNYEEFKNMLLKNGSITKYWNYFISIGAILLGLYCLYETNNTEFLNAYKAKHNKEYPTLVASAITTVLVFVGLYGFWRIPKTYEVKTIEAKTTVEQKVQIINRLVSDFKLKEIKSNEKYKHFRYVGRFWNRLDLFICFDTKNFYINAQQRELGAQSGFIDLGTSKKVANKISRAIRSYVDEESTA